MDAEELDQLTTAVVNGNYKMRSCIRKSRLHDMIDSDQVPLSFKLSVTSSKLGIM